MESSLMDSARWNTLLLFTLAACFPMAGTAAQISGLVRAADQFVPGATVTARQGEAKVTAFTDETGHYTLDLTPGVWQIQVEMFEFTPVTGKVTVGDTAGMRDWVLNMPKVSDRGGAGAAGPVAEAAPAIPGQGGRGNRGGQGGQRTGGGPGRGGQGQGRGPGQAPAGHAVGLREGLHHHD